MPEVQPHDQLVRDWLVLAAAMIVPALILGYLELRRRKTLLPPQRRRAVPWSGLETFASFLACQLLLVSCLLGLLRAPGFLHWFYGPDPGSGEITAFRAGLWASVVMLPVEVACVLALLRLASDTRPYQLGLTTHRLRQNLVLGFVCWLVATPVIQLQGTLVELLFRGMSDAPPEAHHIQKLLEQPAALRVDWVLATLTAVIAAPVLEELLYRGVLQGWLLGKPGRADALVAFSFLAALERRGQGIVEAVRHFLASAPEQRQLDFILGLDFQPALFVLLLLPVYLLVRCRQRSSVAAGIFSGALFFAIMHAPIWPSPIPLFPLGLLLGFLAYRTQGLTAPLLVHALFNGVAMVGLFFRSEPGPLAP